MVTIISGRTVNNLLEFFNGIDTKKINWVGVHGLEIKYKDSDDISINVNKKVLSSIRNLKKQLIKIIKDIPCFHLEDKEESFAVHYRKCQNKDLVHLKTITELIENFIKNKPLDYLKMSRVIEVKPKNIDKGRAFKSIKRKYKELSPSLDICMGDDVTDNYLFRANKKGINIKVDRGNPGTIKTKYFLKNVTEVHDFLNFILDKI